jgi:hypothetical protein
VLILPGKQLALKVPESHPPAPPVVEIFKDKVELVGLRVDVVVEHKLGEIGSLQVAFPKYIESVKYRL